MESEIIYLEDIVKELSEELGVDEAELAEVFKQNVVHLNNLMEDATTVTIRLPALGTLFFNGKKAKGTLAVSDFAFKLFGTLDNLKAKIKITDKLKEESRNSVHNRNGIFNIIRKQLFPKYKIRVKTPRREVLKQMELTQNRRYDKFK